VYENVCISSQSSNSRYSRFDIVRGQGSGPCYIWLWLWRRGVKACPFRHHRTDRLHTLQRTNIQRASIHIPKSIKRISVRQKCPCQSHITSDLSRDLDLDGIPVTPSRERLRHASPQKATTVTPFDFNTDCHRSLHDLPINTRSIWQTL
jgi:hypothetical protein